MRVRSVACCYAFRVTIPVIEIILSPLEEISTNQITQYILNRPKRKAEMLGADVLPRGGTSKAAKSRRKAATLQAGFTAMKNVQEQGIDSVEQMKRAREAVAADPEALLKHFDAQIAAKLAARGASEASNENTVDTTSETSVHDSSIKASNSTPDTGTEASDQHSNEVTSEESSQGPRKAGRRRKSSASRPCNNKVRAGTKWKATLDRQVNKVKKTLGTGLIEEIKKMKKSREARPLLALVATEDPTLPRRAVEAAVGIDICKEEWRQINMHAKCLVP